MVLTASDRSIQEVLKYYGITEEILKAQGGGFIKTRQREERAAADVFIGGALLVYTPEQRMWYEATQLNDLVFFDLPAKNSETLKLQASRDSRMSQRLLRFFVALSAPLQPSCAHLI